MPRVISDEMARDLYEQTRFDHDEAEKRAIKERLKQLRASLEQGPHKDR